MKQIGLGCILLYVLGFGSGVIWALTAHGEKHTSRIRAARLEAAPTPTARHAMPATLTRTGRNDRQDKRYFIDPSEGATEQDTGD